MRDRAGTRRRPEHRASIAIPDLIDVSEYEMLLLLLLLLCLRLIPQSPNYIAAKTCLVTELKPHHVTLEFGAENPHIRVCRGQVGELARIDA